MRQLKKKRKDAWKILIKWSNKKLYKIRLSYNSRCHFIQGFLKTENQKKSWKSTNELFLYLYLKVFDEKFQMPTSICVCVCFYKLIL